MKKPATKELILEHSEQIFNHYFGTFVYGKTYKSPFRVESYPSFNIFYSKKHRMPRYKDFGDSEGNAIDFVMKKENVSFYDAISKIVTELGLPYIVRETSYKYDKRSETTKTFVPEEKKKHLLNPIYFRNGNTPIYTDFDRKYWLKDLKIGDMNLLRKHRTLSARELLIGSARVWNAEVNNPIYIYLEKFENQWWRKAYRPFGESGEKWRSDYPDAAAMLHGLDLMNTKLRELIITKSNKDSIVLDSLGFNVINTQGEDIPIPTHIIEYLKSIYDDIFLFFDNDYTKATNKGRELGDKYSKLYNVGQIIIPNSYEFTDTSEIIQKFNRETTRQLINKWKQ